MNLNASKYVREGVRSRNSCHMSFQNNYTVLRSTEKLSILHLKKGKENYLGNIERESEKSESEVAQSYPTLCDPMDCSPPGSSVHGILHAGILKWVTISFSVNFPIVM